VVGEIRAEFHWKRNRLFDKRAAQAYHDQCVEDPALARVERCKSQPKRKWRPQPMDTVELEKLGAKKLRMSARDVMTTAEKLYTQGFVSYPRTETTIFPQSMDLGALVRAQQNDQRWGRK